MAKSYLNVFEALEDDQVIAENLYVRSRLMIEIQEYIKREGLTQNQAAKHMGVTQPRVSDLVCGKIDLFTIDMLVNMLARAGIKVEITLKNAA